LRPAKAKKKKKISKILSQAECQWLSTVILATQEAEIRRITVGSQPRQIVHETLSQKNPTQKRAGGVAEGVGPDFNSHYHKKKKKKTSQSLEVWFKQ
jgi:hypothetical protein